MSKVLWHTMIIKVPAEMVDFTPKGNVSVKKTLTKMGSISKSQKKPSIKIMPSTDGEVHVIEGKKVSVSGLKSTMKKVKQMEAKNKDNVSSNKKQFAAKVKKYAEELVTKKQARPVIKANQGRLSAPILSSVWDRLEPPAPKPSPAPKPPPAPKPAPKTKSKLSLKDFEYLKKEDLDFILKNDIDEEGARQIDSVKSMIAYYIEENEIKEPLIEAIEDLMIPDKRDSPSVSKWKKFMKDSTMKYINGLKKPTRRELIRKSYSDLTLDDIEFIVENGLEHYDINQMDLIRNRFKDFDKKETLPKFKTKAEKEEYLETQEYKKEKKRKQYLKIEKDDSPALQKWKKSYK